MTSSAKITVTLVSSDGHEFEVAIKAATQSTLIKNMLDDLGVSDKIPLYNVNSVTLAKVMEYCQKHADHDEAAKTETDIAVIGAGAANGVAMEELKQWDAEFLKVENQLLFDIILAANYMEIAGLLDSSCQAVADMIKGKSPEEIRRTFNIKNDFTPEEEEQNRRDCQWAFD
ncbi:SKP1-like protein 1 [Prosopis cineraria]|uniref:SKP1-like protein 1 n=1 Tax=Prosopis cineraria TaxID=364024 RepID=UPI0024105533|nr:SKP1-like protein 1 [Prosopis cineraria]